VELAQSFLLKKFVKRRDAVVSSQNILLQVEIRDVA